ncbi:MAG: radical SAM protein [Alphaproteobacteria bacterium]
MGEIKTPIAFDETAAAAKKKAISRAIKPDASLTTLPPLTTAPKRILLIVPPGTMEEHSGRLSGAAGELPMLGLAFIAAALRDQGNEVKVIDYEVNGWPMSQVARDIEEFKPDMIGMTIYVTNMRRCASVALIAKEVNPDICVVFGGPQVTIFPEEAFLSPDVDVVVLSEGEIIIRNVVNALGDDDAMREVKGIWFRAENGEVVRNQREGLVDNLDILPYPALDLFDMQKYFPPVYIRGKRVAHLLTSRGCPFKCTFCETKLTFGRSFRYHSTERMLRELEKLVAQGYDGFQFYDDIFTANKKRVFDLCQGIIDRGLKIKWMCYSRTNTVAPDMLEIMRKAGCYMISFGIETADDALLDVISKGLSVEHNKAGLQMTKDAGIQTTGTFMLGLPTETAAQTQKTIDFAIEFPVDYAIFGITEPFPGTELWVDAQKYGYFDTSGKYRNALLSENAAVWIPNGRTREELKDFVEKAMWRFYVRPKSIWLGLQNFLQLPPGRAFRYFWAGFVFFVMGRLKPSHLAQRN